MSNMETSRGSAPSSALLIRRILLRSLSDSRIRTASGKLYRGRYDFPHILEANVTNVDVCARASCGLVKQGITCLSPAMAKMRRIAAPANKVNSGLAGSNASSTATTRVGYAMGRVGLLPRVFTSVNERYKTPTWAVHVQAVFALAYLLVLGFALHGPLNALVLQGTISTILIVAIYVLTCVSCIVYYLRAQRRHFNVLLHLVVPLIGALALIPVLLAAFGIDFAHLGITGLTYPADLAPLICLAWMVLGFILLGYFMVRDRSRIAETRRVFTEQTPAERESV